MEGHSFLIVEIFSMSSKFAWLEECCLEKGTMIRGRKIDMLLYTV
jgi:hypothetical protein